MGTQKIISKKFEEVEILDFYSISLFIGKGRKKGQRANFKKPSPILLTQIGPNLKSDPFTEIFTEQTGKQS